MSRAAKVFLVVLAAIAALVTALYLSARQGREPADEASDTPGSVQTPSEIAGDPTSPAGGNDAEAPPDAQTPGPPIPTGNVEGYTIWNGPDDAVSSWVSDTCGREVLRFGAQQYAPGGTLDAAPPDASDLGYHLGDRRLWGDRGAPASLYVTRDGGRTFTEWFAAEQAC